MADCDCKTPLVDHFQRAGIDAHITDVTPIVPTPYNGPGSSDGYLMTCPHGVRWFGQPTSEQIMQWAKDGTP